MDVPLIAFITWLGNISVVVNFGQALHPLQADQNRVLNVEGN